MVRLNSQHYEPGCGITTSNKSTYEILFCQQDTPDNKVHGANIGPTWGRQDPSGPHVGHMNFAIWDCNKTAAIANTPKCLMM